MRKTIYCSLLALALASLFLFSHTTMAATNATPLAGLRVEKIWLDSAGYINIGLLNGGKDNLAPANLVKARLVVSVGKQKQTLVLSKIDPKGKLSAVGHRVVYRLSDKLKAKAVVTAAVSAPGLIDEADAKKHGLSVLLTPATPKPVPAVAATAPQATAQPLQDTSGVKPVIAAVATPAPADIRVTGLAIADNQIVVIIRNKGRSAVSTQDLAKARLVITSQGKAKSFLMAKIDPGARRLNAKNGKIRFATGINLAKRGVVSAVIQGLAHQSPYQAALAPVVKPAAVAQPTKPAISAEPVSSPVVVLISGIELHDGEVRVTLVRKGSAKLSANQIATGRLTVWVGKTAKAVSLAAIDAGGIHLNGFKATAVYSTGVKPTKTVTVRAQLSGIGVAQTKTASLAITPRPKPTAAVAAPVKPEATAVRGKISVFPADTTITPGKSVQLSLRGAQEAQTVSVRLLHNGKAVKGLKVSLVKDKLIIAAEDRELPSGRYEMILLDNRNQEIQRLPLGVSIAGISGRGLLGDSDSGVIRVTIAAAGDTPLIASWAREMYTARLLQVAISPRIGRFSVQAGNVLEWSQLPPGNYTVDIGVPSIWRINGGHQTIEVGAGSVVARTAAVEPLYRIHGTVNDRERPAQGVNQVQVQRQFPPTGYQHTIRTPSVDANGNYSVVVEAGRYRVMPIVPQGSNLPQPIEKRVTVPGGAGQAVRVDFDLTREQEANVATPTPTLALNVPESAPISGDVLLADNSGADGVAIRLEGIDHRPMVTDQNGHYQSEGIRHDTPVTVVPSKPGWNFYPPRANAYPGSHSRFLASPTDQARFVVNGSVWADGRPLVGATVHCAGRTDTTEGTGMFAFRDLPRGIYLLRVEKQGYTFQPEAMNIEISDRNVLGVNFVASEVVAPRGASFISGSVWANVYHNNWPNQQVRLFWCTGGNDPNCTQRVQVPDNHVAVTDGESRYVFRNLGNGRYVVVPPSMANLGTYNGHPYEFHPRERVVNISDRSVSGVNFVGTAGDYNPLSITGQFTTPGDSPLPGNINLRVESCDRQDSPSCRVTNAQVRINADGSFMIWDAPPGYTRLAPMLTNYYFTPQSVMVYNDSSQPSGSVRFDVWRSMGQGNTGNLTIQLVGMEDNYPAYQWQVEYLGLGDMVEYARLSPDRYRAQGQPRQITPDRHTGVATLQNLAVGTYRIFPRGAYPQPGYVVSPEVSYAFVSPGANTVRISVEAAR